MPHWHMKSLPTLVCLRRWWQVVTGFLERFLGRNDMLAYSVMMEPRLIEVQRVLKSKCSIDLHCDPTASHYLKLLMDSVFGIRGYSQ